MNEMLTDTVLFFLSPGVGCQLLGLALLVCGAGLILSHLVITGRRIEKLNETLAPQGGVIEFVGLRLLMPNSP